jgi:hypothetical protein
VLRSELALHDDGDQLHDVMTHIVGAKAEVDAVDKRASEYMWLKRYPPPLLASCQGRQLYNGLKCKTTRPFRLNAGRSR